MPIEITFTPCATGGSMRSSIRVGCGTLPSAPTRPSSAGIEKPCTSASTSPTDRPRAASATARFAVTVDLPTPPLPLVTAMTRVRVPGPNGISRAARPPRRRSVSARRSSADITPTSSATSAIPSTDAAAARTSREMRSAAGQPTIVRTMPT